jgi:hypothetical protein
MGRKYEYWNLAAGCEALLTQYPNRCNFPSKHSSLLHPLIPGGRSSSIRLGLRPILTVLLQILRTDLFILLQHPTGRKDYEVDERQSWQRHTRTNIHTQSQSRVTSSKNCLTQSHSSNRGVGLCWPWNEIKRAQRMHVFGCMTGAFGMYRNILMFSWLSLHRQDTCAR